MKKKFDEEKFAQLANEMPALSEQEQASVLGGDVYLLDKMGYFLSYYDSMDEGIAICSTDPSNGQILGVEAQITCSISGAAFASSDMLNVPDASGNLIQKASLSFEGLGVNREVFQFLADNTNVEWGYSYETGSGGGFLNTTHETNNVAHVFTNDGTYNGFMHNHAQGSGPSAEDIDAWQRHPSYSEFIIYDETTGRFISYDRDGHEIVNES